MTNDTNRPPGASFNVAELLARVDNDRERLLDLLSMFKEAFPGYVKSLEKALVRKDAAEIASVSQPSCWGISTISKTSTIRAAT